jgi:hypothetical protein
LEIQAILTETLGEHAPSYATVKNWGAQFKRDDLSTFLFPGRAKDLSAPRYIASLVRNFSSITMNGKAVILYCMSLYYEVK